MAGLRFAHGLDAQEFSSDIAHGLFRLLLGLVPARAAERVERRMRFAGLMVILPVKLTESTRECADPFPGDHLVVRPISSRPSVPFASRSSAARIPQLQDGADRLPRLPLWPPVCNAGQLRPGSAAGASPVRADLEDARRQPCGSPAAELAAGILVQGGRKGAGTRSMAG